MTGYVLVHARWHGAWCWQRVADHLRQAGHTVVTPERPDLDRLGELVLSQDEPVVLVGHSSSGMLVSAAAERWPDRVGLVGYVSAFLLPNGMIPPEVMREDTESVLADHVVVDQDRQVVMVREPETVFFHDCAPEDAAWAAGQLVPEPLLPPGGPDVALTEAGFGRVPKVYVVCDHDRALGPATQRRMCAMTPCAHVYHLPTGHSPFLAAPGRLAECLIDAAERFIRQE